MDQIETGAVGAYTRMHKALPKCDTIWQSWGSLCSPGEYLNASEDTCWGSQYREWRQYALPKGNPETLDSEKAANWKC